MKTAVVTLRSLTPYSQSKKHEMPKAVDKETADDYDLRTWQDHLHVNDQGHVFIPAMQLNKAIQTAANYLRLKIPGKGSSEYGKHFRGGFTADHAGLDLDIGPSEAICERLYLNADGKPGGNKRVWRRYPTIAKWEGTVTFYIYDETITEEIFERVLSEAGQFIAIGRFRAEKGGYYGRFEVLKCKWV